MVIYIRVVFARCSSPYVFVTVATVSHVPVPIFLNE